jgi:hypothetical protein
LRSVCAVSSLLGYFSASRLDLSLVRFHAGYTLGRGEGKEMGKKDLIVFVVVSTAFALLLGMVATLVYSGAL